MANGKSEPSAPTVTEYVIRDGKQGVFSHPSSLVAQHEFARLCVEDVKNGASRKLTLSERTVEYAALTEDHPQYDKNDPLKVPTGESAMFHPGTVKERKIS